MPEIFYGQRYSPKFNGPLGAMRRLFILNSNIRAAGNMSSEPSVAAATSNVHILNARTEHFQQDINFAGTPPLAPFSELNPFERMARWEKISEKLTNIALDQAIKQDELIFDLTECIKNNDFSEENDLVKRADALGLPIGEALWAAHTYLAEVEELKQQNSQVYSKHKFVF